MSERFFDYQSRLFRLYGERNYEEALQVAEEAGRRFPDRVGRTIYWRACLLCRLGRAEEALQLLQDGLKKGHWWGIPQLTEDADLAPLKNQPEFQEIVRECERRMEAAQAQANPQLKVIEPSGGSAAQSPLLIALHWAGGNAEDFAGYWQAALKEGWLLALPQSSQMCYEDGFWWADRDKGKREVLWAVKKIKESYVFDPHKVVLAGASQGGTLAMLLALEGAIPSRGFLSVVPGLREETLQQLLALLDSAPRELRGWLITGARDYCADLTRRLHEEAVQRGFPWKLLIEPDMGHEFPRDFDANLREALMFLLA